MGMLEDMLGSAVPQGSLAKPLVIGLLTLLASGALHRGATVEPTAAPSGGAPDGGLLGGLGGLLNRFQQNGMGDVMNSWIGPGQNQSVTSTQIGTVLGPEILKTLSQRTGLSEQELMSHLSQILPPVVDKLTPNGRLPTPQEAAQFR